MSIINNTKLKKHKKLIFIILFVVLFLPLEVATPVDLIDINKKYIICRISTATDIDYDVLYDSQGRDIVDLKVENRLLNIMSKAKTPLFDPYSNLNAYIIYTDSNYIEGKTLIIQGFYRARILYPIKREEHNNRIWEWCLFWFEIL